MNCEKLNYGKFSPELKKKLIEYGKQKLKNPNQETGVTLIGINFRNFYLS
jgi:hypothetical protein